LMAKMSSICVANGLRFFFLIDRCDWGTHDVDDNTEIVLLTEVYGLVHES